MKILAWLFSLILAAGVSYLVYLVLTRRESAQMRSLLGMSLFLIRLPKKKEGEQYNNKEKQHALIGAAEQIYAAFSRVSKKGLLESFFSEKTRFAVEVANTADQEYVGLYMAVPKAQEAQLMQAVHSGYPDAEIEKQELDYNIFVPKGAVAAARLKLVNGPYLPIRTFRELDVDPLSQITNTLASIGADEGAAVQIVFRPVGPWWKEKAAHILREMQKGKTLRQAQQQGSFGKEAAKLLTAKPDKLKSQQEKEKEQISSVDQSAIDNIRHKIEKSGFAVNIRLIASAKTQSRADEIIEQLTNVFGQFSSPNANSFTVEQSRGKARDKLIYDFSFRSFRSFSSLVLNTEELTSLWHLGIAGLKTPKLMRSRTGMSEPPQEAMVQGILLLGISNFRGEKRSISFLNIEDRRRHAYIIGQTGTGKTSFIRELIRQDIIAGRGVGVIDPHGDLIEAVLSLVPKQRVDDVVLFEPFDMERPVGLNMLEYETLEQKDFAVQEMIGIFQKLFPPEMIGPMFEHYMRNAMLALMADPANPGTLVEIPRIFTDPDFMRLKLAQVQDPVVRQFWEKEWQQTTGQTRSDMLGYVVSKVGRFVENEMMRNIIGQPRSGFKLNKVMDRGQIFLANLSKGQTGEVNAALLGMILVTKLQMAAMRRASQTEESRKDFFLYIDEFQNFTTDSIATILSEARKYRLNLTIAHQFIAQLEEKIRDAVFGNIGSLFAFRVGAEDADVLAKQFEPEFSAQDLINLPNYSLIARLMIKGEVSSPFRMETVMPQAGNKEVVEPLKRMIKLRYGRARLEVEKEIMERARLGSLGGKPAPNITKAPTQPPTQSSPGNLSPTDDQNKKDSPQT